MKDIIKNIKNYLNIIIITIIGLVPINVMADTNGGSGIINNCSGMLGADVAKYLNYIYVGLLFAVPALTLVLVAKDILTAVTSGKDDDMKKAISTAVKRLIIGLVIFFVPILIKWILKVANIGTC